MTGGPHRFELQGVDLTSIGSGAQRVAINIAPSASAGNQQLITDAAASQLGAPTGDGVVTASAAGGGGGFINVQSATSTATDTVDLTLTVNGGATVAANSVSLKTNGFGSDNALATNGGLGFVSVGDAFARSNLTVNSTITVAGGAFVRTDAGLTIDGRVDLTGSAEAETDAGGLGAGVDSRARARLDYSNQVNLSGTLTAGGALTIKARTALTGDVNAESDADGLGADSDANDTDGEGVRIGENSGETRINLLSGTAVTGQTATLTATVEKLDAHADAHADASALGADSDARGSILVRGNALVVLNSGSSLTGTDALTLETSYKGVNLIADPFAEMSGVGGDTDARAIIDAAANIKVIGRQNAIVSTAIFRSTRC